MIVTRNLRLHKAVISAWVAHVSHSLTACFLFNTVLLSCGRCLFESAAVLTNGQIKIWGTDTFHHFSVTSLQFSSSAYKLVLVS